MKVHPVGRDARSLWQLARRRTGQLWRQKHGRMLLLAPLLVFLFTVFWSAAADSNKQLTASSSPSSSPQDSAAHYSAVRQAALKQAAENSKNSSQQQTSPAALAAKASDTLSDKHTNAQADEDEEEEAKAPDLAKAMADILDFPEDLDGPDNPNLLGLVNKVDYDSNQALQGMVAASSRLFRPDGKFKQNATKDHMVVAMPSDRSHVPLVEATKSWRKDIRTFVTLNDSALAATHPNVTDAREIWGYYPDDWPLKGLHAGDTRAALTPFLAHQMYNGNYSWMLYGDDDTLFFVDSVSELLQDFDPSLPYFITDHFWWADEEDSEAHFHPNERAPRCMPCHWSPEEEAWALKDDGYKPFVGYPACPCTAEHICRHDNRGFFDEKCQIPVHPKRAYSTHGGAGAIISIGMMLKIPLEFMESCIASMTGTGGDAFLSRCIWQAGYAFTDPGYSFYHWEAKSFDPGPESSRKLVLDFSSALLGACAQEPLEVISHVATSHIRAIEQGATDSIQVMHALTSIYDRWRAKVHSILSEANPEGLAAVHLPLPSSSFRSQQPQQAMSYAELTALHSEDPEFVMSIPSTVSQSQGPHKESSSSIPGGIPKGIPKADIEHISTGEDHSMVGNSGLAQTLAGTTTEGFLNFVGEDEDTLALQKQREEEEQKAEDTAQGSSDEVDPESEAQHEAVTVSTSPEEQEEQTAASDAAFGSSSFDRLLEAASSGGMSDNFKPDMGGILDGVEVKGTKKRLNGTANASSNSTRESAGKAALAEALARHNITAGLKAAATERLAGEQSEDA